MRGFSTIQSIIGRAAMLGESAVRDDADAWIEFHLDEVEMSHGDLATLLRTALRAEYPGERTYVWTRDVYDDSVVYEVNTDDQTLLYQRTYTVQDGAVTLGEPFGVIAVTQYVRADTAAITVPATPVTQVSAPAQEAAEIVTDLVPLIEAKAISKDGVARVKVISPGFGSSGYYPAATLEAAAAKFAGVQCFWDHPSASEAADRPERSLRDLAGKIVGTPTWEANGTTGPGIYADLQVFKPYQEAVEELAPHIGVSIRAMGKAGTTKVDGKSVRSIESIDDVCSVDFVTVPGRGGEVLQLFEAARSRAHQQEGDEVSKEALEEAQGRIKTLEETITQQGTELARLKEREILAEARTIVVGEIAKTRLPQLTRNRLTESLVAGAATKDGALDTAALTTAIEAAVKAATDELLEASGGNPVRGMGAGGGEPPATPTLAESQKRIGAALASL